MTAEYELASDPARLAPCPDRLRRVADDLDRDGEPALAAAVRRAAAGLEAELEAEGAVA